MFQGENAGSVIGCTFNKVYETALGVYGMSSGIVFNDNVIHDTFRTGKHYYSDTPTQPTKHTHAPTHPHIHTFIYIIYMYQSPDLEWSLIRLQRWSPDIICPTTLRCFLYSSIILY